MPHDRAHDPSASAPTAAFLDLLIEEHLAHRAPRLRRLWDYFRNEPPGDRSRSHLPQAHGLPARLRRPAAHQPLPQAPEVVIENDIAWRIHTLVDFMFGKPVTLQSCVADRHRARAIESFLQQVFDASGGIGFFQDMALLGAIYGFVDVVLTAGPGGITLELIEAPRAIAILSPGDYRRIETYLVHYRQALNHTDDASLLTRVRRRVFSSSSRHGRRAVLDRTLVWTADDFRAYTGRPGERQLDEQAPNRLGRIPVVHIQNLPQPFVYQGLSEVEPLIPLQDELNTRLSDRANRVTFQSFKMYLGKGIENFTERPIGPGQMWATDNPAAQITEFGGDADSPSETAHISEIREAMDKTSGVSPIAAGILRGKVGNLTSENALRVVLMGLLARTDKKRQTYGSGIVRLAELILHAADVHGLFASDPSERQVRIDWPSALPENDSQRLADARLKLDLGVPRDRVLAELGYGDCAEPDTAK